MLEQEKICPQTWIFYIQSQRMGTLFFIIKGKKLKSWVTIMEALNSVPNHECSKYKLRFNGHLGHRHIDPRKPSPTVTARGDEKGGVVVLHHPSNKRRMTARELAAVQSFPDNFVFAGTKTSAYRQIANAVPPLFRTTVLRSYAGRCFLTGEEIPEVLEAAHIVPVEHGGADSTDNGICLRVDIHRLFDSGNIRIRPTGELIFSGIVVASNNYSALPRMVIIPDFVNPANVYWRDAYY